MRLLESHMGSKSIIALWLAVPVCFIPGCQPPQARTNNSSPIYLLETKSTTIPSWISQSSSFHFTDTRFTGCHRDPDGHLVISVEMRNHRTLSFALQNFSIDINEVEQTLISIAPFSRNTWDIRATNPPIDTMGRLECLVLINTGRANKDLATELNRAIHAK